MEILRSIGVWNIFSAIFSTMMFVCDYNEGLFYELTPYWLYKNHTSNIIVVGLLSVFMLFFFPCYYVLWFIYWLYQMAKKFKIKDKNIIGIY